MKKLITTTILVLCTIGVFASITQKFLVIEADNGDKTYFQDGKAKSFYYEDASFEINPSSVQVLKGSTTQLQAKFNDTEVPATWTSSVESIATVNSSGIVTGVADGEATITATYNGATATSVITVKTLIVDPATAELIKGNTTTLTAMVGDEIVAASWSSSAESIVTVNASTGVVTGVSNGTAIITATYEGVTATGVITVKTLMVNPATAELLKGHTTTLTAMVGDDTVAASWSSSAESIATVNAETGEVTGVSNGIATITATYKGVTATSEITVNDLIIEPATADVFIGRNKTLVAKVDGSAVVASWTSSNSDVVSVNASTGVVTGVSNGTATITATYSGVTATSVITVKTLIVDPATVVLLKGNATTLVAKVDGSAVVASWTSSNSDVVSVNASTGVVTGVSEGTATITATYNGATVTSLIKVVEPSVEMVKVKAGRFEMGKNGDGTSDNETPIHTVILSQDFYIGKYEITQKLWQEVMGSNPSFFAADGENKPVEQVNWYDCIEFCNALSEKDGYDKVYNIDKVNIDPNNTCDYGCIKWTVTINASANGYRLPTEAQWEYASKGGDKASSPYKISSGSDAVDAVAWYYGNSGGETHQVGRKASNELGIYDMTGNVYEWCFDWYGDYSAYAQTDPVGVVSGVNRVVRGGGYNVYDYCCRSAFRNNNAPDHKLFNYGLRVVRLVP